MLLKYLTVSSLACNCKRLTMLPLRDCNETVSSG
nr:MAG TPA: hypothetical protein [Bacteriophage sp.]